MDDNSDSSRRTKRSRSESSQSGGTMAEGEDEQQQQDHQSEDELRREIALLREEIRRRDSSINRLVQNMPYEEALGARASSGTMSHKDHYLYRIVIDDSDSRSRNISCRDSSQGGTTVAEEEDNEHHHNKKICRRDSSIDRLEQHSAQMRNALIAALMLPYKPPAPSPLWDSFSEEMKQDSGFIVAALIGGHLDWWDVPEDLKETHKKIALYGVVCKDEDADFYPCLRSPRYVQYMTEYFREGHIHWAQLLDGMQNIDFARSVDGFTNPRSLEPIFDHYPELRQERDMWMKAVDAKETDGLRDLIEGGMTYLPDFLMTPAPAEIRCDHELMLKACTKDFDIYDLVHEDLAGDQSFLHALVVQNARVLSFMPREFQRRDIVDLALQRSVEGMNRIRNHHVLSIANNLKPEFFDRDFVLQWLQFGLPFINRGPFLALKADKKITPEDIFLLVARRCHSEFRNHSFKNLPMELRRDKKFMLQLLEIAPSLCYLITDELLNDFDLCLLAFSGELSRDEAIIRRRRWLKNRRAGTFHYLKEFRTRLSNRLDMHKIFTEVVLPGLAEMAQTNDSGCALALLNQGAETSKAHMHCLMEYLDAPYGKELRWTRQAFRNFEFRNANLVRHLL